MNEEIIILLIIAFLSWIFSCYATNDDDIFAPFAEKFSRPIEKLIKLLYCTPVIGFIIVFSFFMLCLLLLLLWVMYYPIRCIIDIFKK